MSTRSVLVVLVGLVVVPAVLVGAVLGVLAITSARGPDPVEIVIPAGTAAAVDAGEAVALVPDPLELSVDQQLVIVNQDSEAHTLGPFTIRPGETLDHVFTQPGTFVGGCTTGGHTQQRFVVTA